MDPSFWRERWDTGQIGWHRDDVNPWLLQFADRLTSGRRARILVPLCGKSVDLAYLAARGHVVVGIELVERAIQSFFAEHALQPDVVSGPRGRLYRAGDLTILQADMLEVQPSDVGPIDCVYDRAALIAWPPELRGHYASRLLELMPAQGRNLLVTLSYDPEHTGGPPFSVDDDEVSALFGSSCDIERLASLETNDVSDRLRNAGARETTWLLTKRP